MRFFVLFFVADFLLSLHSLKDKIVVVVEPVEKLKRCYFPRIYAVFVVLLSVEKLLIKS